MPPHLAVVHAALAAAGLAIPSVTSHGAGLVTLLDEFARLGTAVVAGALLGLNRNLRGKAAGLRTHALVALGAAAAAAAAAHSGDVGAASRVMQGVITGVGFLGAGVILHPRTGAAPAPGPDVPTGAGAGAAEPAHPAHRRAPVREVRGLTTAASVWMAAMLGLAAGSGLWSLVMLAALLTLAVLVGGGGVEDAVRRRVRQLSGRRDPRARRAG